MYSVNINNLSSMLSKLCIMPAKFSVTVLGLLMVQYSQQAQCVTCVICKLVSQI